MPTIEEMTANRLKWAEALRSGQYKQGRLKLRSHGNYCCLGVACAMLTTPDEFDNFLADTGNQTTHVPAKVSDAMGMDWFTREALATANDDGKSFADIANVIEKVAKSEYFNDDVRAVLRAERQAIMKASEEAANATT